jgi:uncharacterized protein
MKPLLSARTRALLLIAKRPTPGQTKTRLTPPLTVEQASALYEAFLRDTIEIARAVPDVTRLINYLPAEADHYFGALAPDFDLLPQVGDQLGERLDHALTHCLHNGFQQAVIMDSDSPTLPAAHLTQAFIELERADVVLGPCEDGGYYLIGLTRPQPRLLREVQMSTATVLNDTLALAEELKLRVALLPIWYDVDTFAELTHLTQELSLLSNGCGHHTRTFLKSHLAGSATQSA